ncbi:hypothetical protein CPT03_02180 [Pedobacter ginsengisoli]|uniref:Uncharacterized protein n=1 Tax=Pedobacter ginsengisoli TaxID=363852 RepID=A0A2D1U170_9SPHI|nr:hypothetical protein CPT03_02180 [Pedobacter ginsengisoli]
MIKDKGTIPDAATFETSDYTFKPLEKIDQLPPINYPAGFKSTAPVASQSEGRNKESGGNLTHIQSACTFSLIRCYIQCSVEQ